MIYSCVFACVCVNVGVCGSVRDYECEYCEYRFVCTCVYVHVYVLVFISLNIQ